MISTLSEAAGLLETSLVVRSPGAVAEIRGPLPVRRGVEWLTLGEEGGSHAHLRLADLHTLRFADPADRNAALEILADDGTVLCRLSFCGTNSARSESYDRARADRLRARFAAFREASPERP
jgi:hypothetical protein